MQKREAVSDYGHSTNQHAAGKRTAKFKDARSCLNDRYFITEFQDIRERVNASDKGLIPTKNSHYYWLDAQQEEWFIVNQVVGKKCNRSLII